MNIGVIGGSGFIGSHVCRALLKRFDEVVGFDDFNQRAKRKHLNRRQLD